MTDDSETQLAGQGLRVPRVNCQELLEMTGGIYENDNPNPDSPAASKWHKRGVGSSSGGASQPRRQQQRQAADLKDRPAKRQRAAKMAAQVALELAGDIEAAEEEEICGASSPAVAAPKLHQKRQRVLVDVHRGIGASTATAGTAQHPALEEVENEYERQRLQRILRNEQMLRQLGVQEAAAGVAAAAAAEQHAPQGPTRGRGLPRPRERRPVVPAAHLPVRKSARQRGDRPLTAEEAVAAAAAELGAGGVPDLSQATDKELEHSALLDLDQYFQLIGQDITGAVHSDGSFRGWVNPAVCERYGVAVAPEAAWEAGGGGRFSFKIDKKAIPAGLKGRGWSDARAFSHTQLLKNPNAYFYRHVAPHEQQAQGEWTEEEHALFVGTARAHGVGDKWGLFASYMPQRVGYQCSAYYRDVIIPQGLVIDRRFKMTHNGKAVYVG